MTKSSVTLCARSDAQYSARKTLLIQDRFTRSRCYVARALCLLALASAGVPYIAAASESSPKRIVIAGIGRSGSYDASLAQGPSGRLWMSYSVVKPSPEVGTVLNHISTHLAYSDDRGHNWIDAGRIVNLATAVALPPPHNHLAAVWEHEVPAIVYDPHDVPSRRWKLLWHRYLRVYDQSRPVSVPLFEHGWVGLKTAPAPRGQWSRERKLFAGAIYNRVNDVTIGPPELELDKLFPGQRDLGNCLAFTEPGMLADAEGIYVSMKCAAGKAGGKVILLKCAHDFASCDYRGTFLSDSDARHYGDRYSGFSATELVRKNGRVFLLVTPTEDPGELYRGCLAFEIRSLETATLYQRSGSPKVILRVVGDAGSINGACGYTPGSDRSGVIYGQYFHGLRPAFRLFRSGRNL